MRFHAQLSIFTGILLVLIGLFALLSGAGREAALGDSASGEGTTFVFLGWGFVFLAALVGGALLAALGLFMLRKLMAARLTIIWLSVALLAIFSWNFVLDWAAVINGEEHVVVSALIVTLLAALTTLNLFVQCALPAKTIREYGSAENTPVDPG